MEQAIGVAAFIIVPALLIVWLVIHEITHWWRYRGFNGYLRRTRERREKMSRLRVKFVKEWLSGKLSSADLDRYIEYANLVVRQQASEKLFRKYAESQIMHLAEHVRMFQNEIFFYNDLIATGGRNLEAWEAAEDKRIQELANYHRNELNSILRSLGLEEEPPLRFDD